MDFIKTPLAPLAAESKKAYWFIFSGSALLVQTTNDSIQKLLPLLAPSDVTLHLKGNPINLGNLNSIPCYAGFLRESNSLANYELLDLRFLFDKLDHTFWTISGYGHHILKWLNNNQYCGRCGEKTELDHDEVAITCTACNNKVYPRISPAIIVAITNQDKILLARGVNFPDPEMHSIIAGFVEPGETLEECVEREVFEEVGIKIQSITYIGSQPWPFPDSLMVGFTAEYEAGDINIDPKEIVEANWFSLKDLPKIPNKLSISRKLIDHCRQIRGISCD